MTENINKFGIKDIFSVIKKNIILILGLFFVSFSLFGLITIKKLLNTNKTNTNISKIYTASIDYYLEPKSEILNNENINFFRAIPDDFVAFLNTSACADYIYNRLLDIYNIGELAQNTYQDQTIENNSFQIKNIKNLYTVKREKNTMIVKVASFARDKKMCEDILKIIKEYTNFELKKVINSTKIQESNTIVQFLDSNQILEEYPDSNFNLEFNISKTKITKIIIKNLILPVFVLMFLLVFSLALFSYFNPTLNRMSDFCEYDIQILGELNQKNDEQYKYISNNIIDISKQENKKVFVFFSSIYNQNSTKKINLINIISKIQENISNKSIKTSLINNINLNLDDDKLAQKVDLESQNSDIILVCVPNILEKSEAFECAKTYKNIILIEKCLHSYYSNYEKIIFCLNQHKISPRGVIILN